MDALTHLEQLARAGNVPFSVMLEVTGRCNLDCEHCYLDIRNPPKELGTEEWFDVLGQLQQAGSLVLVVTGGEVFLRKDLLAILGEARRLGFLVRLNTSGTRLTRRDADHLATLGLTGVELSLYSHLAAVHDAVTRRRGSFLRTLRAAAMLRRRDVHVVLKAPLMERTLADYAGVQQLAARLGAEAKFDPSVIARRDGNLTPTQHRPASAALAAVLRDPSIRPQGGTLPPPMAHDEAPCGVARTTCRIAPNGDVYPCSTFPEPVGNLRTKRFRDIWWGDHPTLHWLRNLRFGDLGPTCTGCAKSGYCNRCIALAVIEHGDALGPVSESCRVADAHGLAHGSPDAARAPEIKPRRKLPLLAAPWQGGRR